MWLSLLPALLTNKNLINLKTPINIFAAAAEDQHNDTIQHLSVKTCFSWKKLFRNLWYFCTHSIADWSSIARAVACIGAAAAIIQQSES